MFWYRDDSDPALDWGFTDAVGEATGPFGGFNLAHHVGDAPDVVSTHRTRLEEELRAPVVFMNQCHGATVHEVEGPWEGDVPPGDGILTPRAGLGLAVMVADCTPVLLADPDAGLVAAVHAGRPGLLQGVVPATVARLRERGATALRALVGPSVCGRCYEVPAAMRDEVAAAAPAARAVSWTGTPALDVAAGVVEQLAHLGVPLTWVAGCTREEERLYSYRRCSTTGRFAGFVVRRQVGA